MEKQIIIAVSREFGSGGHYIAQKIAKDFGIAYYDRKIIEAVADENNVRVETLERYDEKRKMPIFTRRVKGYTNSIAEIVLEMQFEHLRGLADSGESFVIVGRCADELFRGDERLTSFFVLADEETKIQHVIKRDEVDRQGAISLIAKKDLERKRYHNRHSEFKWGDSRAYDLCVNSSRLGIEKTAEVLEHFICERHGISLPAPGTKA